VDIYNTVGKRLFQEIHTYFQIVNIETDIDFIGFDEFENIKTDTYLKYDEMIIMSNLIENDIYETGESFCDFTIKLSENVRVERRTYTKLITILGDVGGLMEVLFTLFRVICSLSVDILYDISLVNNLFDFDLDKKIVILKEKKKQKENIILRNERPKIYSPIKPNRKISANTFFVSSEKSLGTANRMNEETIKNNKLNINNKNSFVVKFEKKISGLKGRYRRPQIRSFDNDSVTKNNLNSLRKKNFNKKNEKNELDEIEYDYDINNFSNEENEQRRGNIISKIKMTRACIYLCFCCTRRRKIIQNVLLDEGINIISNKLDIFNIFDKLYRDEKIHEKLWKHEVIEMSDKCKARLLNIWNKSYKI